MSDRTRLSRAELQQVIERAAILDGDLEHLSLAEVERIADDLDISREALHLALAERATPRARRPWREALMFGMGGAALGLVNHFLWGIDGVFGYTPEGGLLIVAAMGIALFLRSLFPTDDRPHVTYQLDSAAAWLGMIVASGAPFWGITPVVEMLADVGQVFLSLAGLSAAVGALITSIRLRRNPEPPAGPQIESPNSRGDVGIVRRIARRFRSWLGRAFVGIRTPRPQAF